jgi:hypothetical protein
MVMMFYGFPMDFTNLQLVKDWILNGTIEVSSTHKDILEISFILLEFLLHLLRDKHDFLQSNLAAHAIEMRVYDHQPVFVIEDWLNYEIGEITTQSLFTFRS